MEKLLTVSIAAYNVEQYLSQALDSCLLPEYLDKLEVIIVNDGSKDRTPQIAQAYCKKYPNTFRLISKENGGYGSTVNISMREARGKFFRLLDGDDWFESNGLATVLSVLENSSSDLVITPIYRVHEGSGEKSLRFGSWKPCVGKTLSVEEITRDCDCILGMWHITVRTALLREHSFSLPEHRLYTDQLFVLHSMAYANELTFLSEPLYCYRVGRDGQSVSKESRIKNRHQSAVNVLDMASFYSEQSDLPSENRRFLQPRLGIYYAYAAQTFLLAKPSVGQWVELTLFIRKVKKKAPDIYNAALERNSRFRRLHRTHNLVYWKLAGRIDNWY